MAKSKRKSLLFTVILCSMMGALLLINGRGFMPVASGQSYPNFDCNPIGNPCPTCPQNLNRWECQIVLNGWSWGDCTTPLGAGCTLGQSPCGQKVNCQNPPVGLQGNDCQAIFDICN